ncbi:Defensin-like protein 183 [Glycine soja]|uniref:Defensin-like protein n=1 Tax=Glycine soja TaxID=3848 RepID=A0A445IXH9_GLYSO|nr:defensin-like protein 183 [Glycine soja]KHN35797.1 Defensin-like protein 183 [Glycine soja]RZB90796.1 Defensin-like protein 183 [Glycine soja]
MVHRISNYVPLFIILILLVTVQKQVEGLTCSRYFGLCSDTRNCDLRCKARNKHAEGHCDDDFNCTCIYPCDSPQPNKDTEPIRKCTSGLGLCSVDHCYDDCCNSKCAKQFKEGIGHCEIVGSMGTILCTCDYVC